MNFGVNVKHVNSSGTVDHITIVVYFVGFTVSIVSFHVGFTHQNWDRIEAEALLQRLTAQSGNLDEVGLPWGTSLGKKQHGFK